MTDRTEEVENAAERGIEQFDLQKGMDFDLTPGAIMGMANDLGEAEAYDTEVARAEELAQYVEAIRALEDAAEEAKGVFEEALEEHVEVGDSIMNLRRQTGKNTWVADTEGAFAAVSQEGHDPLDVAKVSIGSLREVLGDEAAEEFIGEAEYDYFVRQS